MISFMIVAADDAVAHDVDAEAQQKFSVPSVPLCSVPMEQAKRLQVVDFKGVLFLFL
jgi:nucleoside phosphorylase